MADKDANLQLIAAVYADQDRGKVILDMLESMHKNDTITLKDAALVSKTDDGKFKIEETVELTARKGGRRGAIILGIVGLIYPPSLIATVIAGGGIGALAGALRDTGIKKDELKEFADSIQPGQSAVVALADAQFSEQIQDALGGYEGTLLTHEIAGESAEDIQAAAEKAEAEA
jgi:uncharacterized membrane protein